MSQRQAPSITAFFPAYNDAATIASVVIAADRTLRSLTRHYEIIVVNDASPDHCAEILEDLALRYPALRVVTHPQNRGYGGALRSGFANASNELVFYTDGDAQYDPRQLTDLMAALRDDVDLVNGYKVNRDDSLLRRLSAFAYARLVRAAFGLRLRDVQCDFRLVRRSALEKIVLTSNSGAICVELVKSLEQAGCRAAEVPIRHFPRASGRSQFFRSSRIAESLLDLVRLWTRFYSSRAARVETPPQALASRSPRPLGEKGTA